MSEELDASFDTERSMSFGFSDSDDDVIEELSAEEEEESVCDGEANGSQEVESASKLSDQNGLFEEDSEIERLKV